MAMRREAFRIAMLAWVTAVLVASPLLAASACWKCCSEKLHATQPARPVAAAHPACCAERAALPTDRCSECLRCESARPLPSTLPVATTSWQSLPVVSDLVLPSVELVRPTVRADVILSAAASSVPHPSLQTLYCSWRE
jgi:hypothetical protein